MKCKPFDRGFLFFCAVGAAEMARDFRLAGNLFRHAPGLGGISNRFWSISSRFIGLSFRV
ncbi:hypothetical protein C1N70_00185 [Cytobacillus firmus]